MTEAHLSELDVERVAARVVELLIPRLGRPEPLLTKAQLAAHLGVETAQIDRFVRRGMPRETVGASPRFRLSLLESWLADNARQRSRAPQPSSVASGPVPGVTRLGRGGRG